MNKKSAAALMRGHTAESNEELVGVLTAISVVSKRLAKRLVLLERNSAERNGDATDVSRPAKPPNADSG